jgi:hypothetical protein
MPYGGILILYCNTVRTGVRVRNRHRYDDRSIDIISIYFCRCGEEEREEKEEEEEEKEGGRLFYLDDYLVD